MSHASAERAPARLLCLGDSYTIGEAVEERERWPVLLVGLLRAAGVAVDPPTIIARTGWTTDELASAIESAHVAGPYDLATLLIGVNNQYRGRAVSEYESQFAKLLLRAIEFAGRRPARVVVLSIPDWGVTPFAAGRDRARIAAELDEFNAAARVETVRRGARWVDVTPVSRRAASEPVLIARDGLHPSGAMYEAWARLVLPVAREALRG